jgi:hypothetical protein
MGRHKNPRWADTATDIEIVERFHALTTARARSVYGFAMQIRELAPRLYPILLAGLIHKTGLCKEELNK